jgi:sulfoxide reductase heme-binding subunit YedZ
MYPRTSSRLAGWPIVGWCSLFLVMVTAAVFGARGIGEQGLRALIRATAQTSFVLFVSAFSASALAAIWPSPLTRWLLRNRRYLGVSFAVSHFLHLLAIIVLVYSEPSFALTPATLVGGGLAYVFIAAMTATSFDSTAAWLGSRAWRLLHSTGVYYIWFIFFISYAPRAFIASVAYVPIVVVLVAAMALRVIAAYQRRHGACTAVSALR